MPQKKSPAKTGALPQKKSPVKTGVLLPLLILYAVCVCVRYLLATLTTNFPTVYIDEFLYYSLGRSIATEGNLLYYGQPADYTYIVYPLLLSPIYKLFGDGTNYYRMLQLWNIMLMSLAVFPIYGLVREMVRRQKTAMWLTAAFMLIPDFILGQFIFSETVIYPLFYALMYCVYRSLKQYDLKLSVWVGVLGALLYYTKPGAVVPAVLALVLFAGGAIRKKDRKYLLSTAAGAAGFAAVFFLLKLIAEKALGYQGSMLSIYYDQSLGYNEINHDYFYRTAAQYPYYILLACGILPFVMALRRLPDLDREDRKYFLFLAVCTLATVIGAAWAINRPERKDILYLRYVEMYFPLFFMYCLIPEGTHGEVSGRSRRAAEILGYALLAYTVVSTFLWGSTTGVTQGHDTHFLISLASLFTKEIKWTANIIVLLLCGATVYLTVRKGNRQTVTKICCAVYGVLILLNNIAAYSSIAENTNPALAVETAEIHSGLEGREYLHVCAPDQCDYGLDVNSRRNILRVNINDFLGNIEENKGAYVPFVPSSTRGMTAERKTPETDTLVIDEHVFENIHFNEHHATSYVSKYNSFEIVVFRPGERIVDSILTGSVYPNVEANKPCYLTVFDEKLLEGAVKVRLEIESATDQTMEFSTNGTDFHTIPVKAGRFWYDLAVGTASEEYTIIIPSSQVKLHEYEVVRNVPEG